MSLAYAKLYMKRAIRILLILTAALALVSAAMVIGDQAGFWWKLLNR